MGRGVREMGRQNKRREKERERGGGGGGGGGRGRERERERSPAPSSSLLQALEESCRVVENDSSVAILRSSPVTVGRVPERIREVLNECLMSHGVDLQSLVDASPRGRISSKSTSMFDRGATPNGRIVFTPARENGSPALRTVTRLSADDVGEGVSDVSLAEEKTLLQHELFRAKKKLKKMTEERESLGEKVYCSE